MTDLTTRYLGLDLRHPVVASAGPLSQDVEGIKALADGGVSAVVLYSLFEEQLRHEEAKAAALEELFDDSFAESLSFFPTVPSNGGGTSYKYLELVERAVAAVDVPVIASINGATVGGWTGVARQLQDAGAAAIELNIYFVPGDVATSGPVVEERHLEILSSVKDAVEVPVAVKLSPYFSSVGNMCSRLDQEGADGLVLFNRFLQPDINLDRVSVEPGVYLSTQNDARLPRTWIAALHGRVRASLAASGGVDDAADVVKYVLAGADVVCTTSALIRHGASHASRLVDGLEAWLGQKGLTLDAARGLLAVPRDASADAYERAGYVAALEKVKQTYGSLV
ncbi:MAG: dihydroorotate dehydrogenase-like protein [Propionibacteriaceae bacterium]|nr:dihydroorotate dehydrogenase-like protein [Propionibacteriaceae bacterium]